MKWLTVAEVATTIRMTEDYVTRLCKSKQIRAKKLGNQWRISDTALEDFMREGETEPTRPGRTLTKRQRAAVEQRTRARS